MSDTNTPKRDYSPAFPCAGMVTPNGDFYHPESGMTVRMYAAIKFAAAMAPLVAQEELTDKEYVALDGETAEATGEYLARVAFIFADAMIAESKK